MKQCICADPLQRICADPLQDLVKQGGLDCLVQLLNGGGLHAETWAAGVLHWLAFASQEHAAAIAQEAIPGLVALLSQGSAVAQTEAAGTLWRLALGAPGRAADMFAADAVPHLTLLVAGGSVATQTNAAGALWAFATASEDHAVAMTSRECVRALVDLLKFGRAQAQEVSHAVVRGSSDSRLLSTGTGARHHRATAEPAPAPFCAWQAEAVSSAAVHKQQRQCLPHTMRPLCAVYFPQAATQPHAQGHGKQLCDAFQQAARDLFLEKGWPHMQTTACRLAAGFLSQLAAHSCAISLPPYNASYQLNIYCCRWQRGPWTSCQPASDSSATPPHKNTAVIQECIAAGGGRGTGPAGSSLG